MTAMNTGIVTYPRANKGTGRRQTPYGELSARINWLVFQLKGSYGNLSAASYQLSRHKAIEQLETVDGVLLMGLLSRASILSKELNLLQAEIAEFNKNKKRRRLENSPPAA